MARADRKTQGMASPKLPQLGSLRDDTQALDRIKSFLKAGESMRQRADVSTFIGFGYGYGGQHGQQSYNPANGNMRVHFLPRRVNDVERRRMRVTMNTILSDIRQQRALLGFPDQLPVSVTQATSSVQDYNATSAAEALMPHIVRISRLKERYRDANDARWVIGTCFIMLQRRLNGRAYPMEDANGDPLTDPDTGEPLTDSDGRPLMVPGNQVECVTLWPHQVTVDPGVRSNRLADHESLAVTAPMTFDEIDRFVGKRYDPKDGDQVKLHTLGELRQVDDLLAVITETQTNPNASESEKPAALVHVAFYRDPTDPTSWPWMTVYSKQILVDHGLIYNGPAPVQCRPLYRFDLELPPGAFYGKGLPHLKMQSADFQNLAWSAMANHFGDNFSTKWFAEEGQFADPKAARRLLASGSTEIVSYKKPMPTSDGPRRVDPPAIPDSALQILRLAADTGDRQVNTNDVQRGHLQTHQTTSGLRMQNQRGDAPLEEIASRDTEELSALLGGLLDASVGLMVPLQIDTLTGRELTPQQIRDLFVSCQTGRRMDVCIEYGALLLSTRAQKQQFIMTLAEAGHLNDENMLAMLAEQTGIVLDETERLARDMARKENRALAVGIPTAPPSIHEKHTAHIREHVRQLNNAGFKDRNPDGYRRIEQHLNVHFGRQAEQELQPNILRQAAVNQMMNRPPLEGIDRLLDSDTRGGALAGAPSGPAGGAEASAQPPENVYEAAGPQPAGPEPASLSVG